jgi:hypothetical protein
MYFYPVDMSVFSDLLKRIYIGNTKRMYFVSSPSFAHGFSHISLRHGQIASYPDLQGAEFIENPE